MILTCAVEKRTGADCRYASSSELTLTPMAPRTWPCFCIFVCCAAYDQAATVSDVGWYRLAQCRCLPKRARLKVCARIGVRRSTTKYKTRKACPNAAVLKFCASVRTGWCQLAPAVIKRRSSLLFGSERHPGHHQIRPGVAVTTPAYAR